MTRDEVVAIAIEEGWKPWGRLRPYPENGSRYQCFRRGNEYAWIGLAYAESIAWAHALALQTASERSVRKFLHKRGQV